ncbi:MEDS domain-containing protein [Streptomyces sp. HNM0574]|uniref:MEDS domain-containing protein n=1 Tax=Streptomyces sp. HNM0574 TaxID=2714954 RepID=UPI00146F36DE|nr:hypothetical protein [Streptomyces sp. HNM0574]
MSDCGGAATPRTGREAGDAVTWARTIPVQRLRPGDHAFAAYADDEGQWDVLGAFVRQGLLAGEKVLVLLLPGLARLAGPELLARMDAHTPAVETAWRRGQLAFGSMRQFIPSGGEFTPERQWRQLGRVLERAAEDGYPAVRAYIDMAWVAEFGADLETVMRRERESGHLFTPGAYSEVCAYDERAFPADVLDAMAEAHPRELLGRTGSLRATHREDGVRVAGEADAATAALFGHALRTAFARAAGAGRGRLTVDLTPLAFLGVGCAAELLRMCAQARTDRVDVTLRCSRFQGRTLERLGSGAVPSLHLDVAEEPGC